MKSKNRCCDGKNNHPRFLKPYILLILYRGSAHGYAIHEIISKEFTSSSEMTDIGAIYRILRHFDEQGLTESSWDTEGKGPAVRKYSITDKGIEELKHWHATIQEKMKYLDKFTKSYKKLIKG